MADDRTDEKGAVGGAHTADLPPPAGPPGADPTAIPGRAQLDGSVADLVAAILGRPDGDQAELFDLSDDDVDQDLPIKAAETSIATRRARGRPKGATNRRNADLFDYLEACGFRDPAVTLAAIQSTNPVDLAQELGLKPEDALKAVIKAAEALMPYKYARKPQELTVTERGVHLFVAGTMDVPGGPDDATLSIHGEAKTIENQSVSDADTVRPQDD